MRAAITAAAFVAMAVAGLLAWQDSSDEPEEAVVWK